jgi:broad specificity phosphatase PhoE
VDQLLLIRHAQTPANARGAMNPDHDAEPALTDRGAADARAMAVRLATEHVEAITCTARLRTRRTAEAIAAVHAPPPRIVCLPELSEIVAGEFAGRPVADYRAWVRERPLWEAPAGGESMLAAAGRYAAGLRSLAALPARGVVAVLHNLPLRMTANVLAGDDPVGGAVQVFPQDEILRVDRGRLVAAATSLAAWAEAVGPRAPMTSKRKGR